MNRNPANRRVRLSRIYASARDAKPDICILLVSTKVSRTLALAYLPRLESHLHCSFDSY